MQRLIAGVHKFRQRRVWQLPQAVPSNCRKTVRTRTRCSSPARIRACWPNSSRRASPAICSSSKTSATSSRPRARRAAPIPPPPRSSSPSETLRVSDIVICGHSQCGAMSALLGENPAGESMPHLRDWLNLATPVLETMRTQYIHLTKMAERMDAAAAENVLVRRWKICTAIRACRTG